MRDGGLDQVPRAIKLVAPAQIDERTPATTGLKPSIDIAVGLLCVGHQPDQALDVVGR